MARNIQILTFNILANCWADPSWYLPTIINPKIFDEDLRRFSIIRYLKKKAAKVDVIALQEVTDVDFALISDALPDFEGYIAHNDPSYWSDWILPHLPWVPNGTAIFLKKSVFINICFEDLALSDSGNHAVRATAVHSVSGQAMRLFSIHLDSDLGSNRKKELASVIAQTPANPNIVDFIIGDYNANPLYNPLVNILNSNNFTLPLTQLGPLKPTHPFLLPKYYLDPKWGVISHIATRGNIVAIKGGPVEHKIWNIKNEALRIEANMAITGSDHFPVIAELNF